MEKFYRRKWLSVINDSSTKIAAARSIKSNSRKKLHVANTLGVSVFGLFFFCRILKFSHKIEWVGRWTFLFSFYTEQNELNQIISTTLSYGNRKLIIVVVDRLMIMWLMSRFFLFDAALVWSSLLLFNANSNRWERFLLKKVKVVWFQLLLFSCLFFIFFF